MNVFYDLETTGIETKHQILSACFIKTDKDFNIKDVQNFNVALNPLEIPAESAILTNSVDIRKYFLHSKHRHPDLITEKEFADKLNTYFLGTIQKNYNLIGYNSNKFDIQHIRKVLIKYGYSPYYKYNQFEMIDLYNHIKYISIVYPAVLRDIKDLKLGSVYQHLIKKPANSQHEADADTKVCIELAKHLKFNLDWDIVKENYKTNNIFELELSSGDIIISANPNRTLTKYFVHDTNKNYILLESIPKEDEESHFRLVKSSDFTIAKKTEGYYPGPFKTIEESFDEMPDNGVENFIYKVKFNDFEYLKKSYLKKSVDSKTCFKDLESPVGQMKAYQEFTNNRPIKHTDNGLDVDDFSNDEIKFMKLYYNLYLKEELEKRSDEPILQFLNEYKEAYLELFKSL